jgi:aspartate dehydrogenase
MRICIIGQGAIAEYVRTQLAQQQQQQQSTPVIEEVAQIVRPGKEQTDASPPRFSSIRDIPDHINIDLVVDCAGHSALIEHGPTALLKGMDVLTVSLGALADAALYQQLQNAAVTGNARLTLASGAIGGLDTLRSAVAGGGLDTVTYIGRKPPAGWKGSPAETKLGGAEALCAISEEAVHFIGTAREAALQYPKNANVAAAVALAGIGFDKTSVKLIADPNVASNIHEIFATGAFGGLNFSVAGKSLPENPRSSALAAMSVVAGIMDRQRKIGF